MAIKLDNIAYIGDYKGKGIVLTRENPDTIIYGEEIVNFTGNILKLKNTYLKNCYVNIKPSNLEEILSLLKNNSILSKGPLEYILNNPGKWNILII